MCFIGFCNCSNFLLTSRRPTSRFSFLRLLRCVACLSAWILLLYSSDPTKLQHFSHAVTVLALPHRHFLHYRPDKHDLQLAESICLYSFFRRFDLSAGREIYRHFRKNRKVLYLVYISPPRLYLSHRVSWCIIVNTWNHLFNLSVLLLVLSINYYKSTGHFMTRVVTCQPLISESWIRF